MRHNQVCKYFQAGNCSYGDRCRYDHIKPTVTTAPTRAPARIFVPAPAPDPVLLATEPSQPPGGMEVCSMLFNPMNLSLVPNVWRCCLWSVLQRCFAHSQQQGVASDNDVHICMAWRALFVGCSASTLISPRPTRLTSRRVPRGYTKRCSTLCFRVLKSQFHYCTTVVTSSQIGPFSGTARCDGGRQQCCGVWDMPREGRSDAPIRSHQ